MTSIFNQLPDSVISALYYKNILTIISYTSGLYYKQVMIVIYDRNDIGLYYKTRDARNWQS